jgi:hypothetical protein
MSLLFRDRVNQIETANQGNEPERRKTVLLSIFYNAEAGASYTLKPAVSMPRWASGFFMNVSHTNPERAFSAITIVMPVSMPTTSVAYCP